MDEKKKLGPTGRFPFGKRLEPSDQGEIMSSLRIDREKKLVFVEFGMPLDWFVLSKDTLRKFIKGLNDALKEIE